MMKHTHIVIINVCGREPTYILFPISYVITIPATHRTKGFHTQLTLNDFFNIDYSSSDNSSIFCNSYGQLNNRYILPYILKSYSLINDFSQHYIITDENILK